MTRDLECFDLGEIRVGRNIESVHEQIIDPAPSELAGRQADTVNDKQVDLSCRRAVIHVFRWVKLSATQ